MRPHQPCQEMVKSRPSPARYATSRKTALVSGLWLQSNHLSDLPKGRQINLMRVGSAKILRAHRARHATVRQDAGTDGLPATVPIGDELGVRGIVIEYVLYMV
nr:hypothetical protein CFP56_03722 [Quercus suber]